MMLMDLMTPMDSAAIPATVPPTGPAAIPATVSTTVTDL